MSTFSKFRPQQQGGSKRTTLEQFAATSSSSSSRPSTSLHDQPHSDNNNSNNNNHENTPLPAVYEPDAYDSMFDALSAVVNTKFLRQESLVVSLRAPPSSALPSFDTIPFDWSLINRIRFTSPNSFFWCSTSSTHSIDCGLKENFCNNDVPSAISDDSAAFQRACLLWVHPSSVLTSKNPIIATVHIANSKPPETMTADEVACIHYVHQRWLDWEDSFRSVYYRLRNGLCRSFYYESTYIALFLGPSEPHLSDYQVIISSSTPSLRALLTKLDIHFTRPLFRETEVAGEPVNEEDERVVGELRRKRVLRGDEEHDALSSILVVSGKNDVHATYDMLLNFNKRLGDVPVLTSDTAFVGATLKMTSITKNNELPRAAVASDEQYCLDLQGPILPSQWIQLCHLFAKTQHQFKAYLSLRPFSTVFNVVPLPQLQTLGPTFPPHSLLSSRVDVNDPRGVLGLRRVEYKNKFYEAEPGLPSST